MRNPFKRREKALTASPSAIDSINQGFAPFQLLGSGSRDRIVGIYNAAQNANYSWLYLRSPALRTVIDLIVRDIGELDLCLFEEVSEQELQPADDHPAALSLKYPGENDTSDGFIRSLLKDFLIYDNAYASLSEGPNGRILLNHIPSYMVEVQGVSLFEIDNFRVWPQGAWNSNGSYSGGSGTYTDIDPGRMLHWHGENPLDPRIGLSHLDTLRGVLAEDAALQQATVELANAGLQEAAWVFRPLEAPAWSNAAREGFEEDLTNRMRSRNEKPVVLEEGMEMRSFGITPHDAQLMDVRKWALSQVATEYGVPPGKVGLTPATNEDETMYVKDVLLPTTKNMSRMFDHRILVQAFDLQDYCFKFNMDERLMSDNRLTALTSASGRAVLLTNEARAKLGLPPVEGGDEILTPVNQVAGPDPESALQARQPPAPKPGSEVMPIQDPNKPAQDGSYRQDQGPTPVQSGNGGKALTALEQGSERLLQLHPTRSADMERQRRNVDTFQGVVQKHFNRLGRSLSKSVDTNWERWDREFADDLNGTLQRVVQSEGDIYGLKMAGANFSMAEVQHYLRAMAEGAASAINDTIRAEIESDGLEKAMARASQHVASAGTSLGVRSTVWAREEAARQSGSYEHRLKTWVADTGRHAEWDGVTVPIDQDWPSGFAPGGVAGCQCTASIS